MSRLSEGLTIYPQLRRTLFVLPDENSSRPRDFISFNLNKVDDSYAADRNYNNWSVLIVGHYLATSFFNEKSNLLSLAFYDLDYDFNAKSVHKIFTADKNTVEITGNNQPVRLKDGIDGWYLVNSIQKEVSFSTKSYVIAIDTAATGSLQREDLVNAANDLKVWTPNARPAEIIDAK